MHVDMLTVGPFQSNTFIAACPDTREAILIDAGDEADRILGRIGQNGLQVKMIVLTHAHLDHVGALAAVAKALGVPVLMHKDETPIFEAMPMQAAMFGLPAPEPGKVDRYIIDGEKIAFGNQIAEVVHTPGHSPGGVCLVFRDTHPPCVFVGDVLFNGSIGRTDLQGADHVTMIQTLKNVIMKLPDDMVVYSGHGPETTIGFEKRTNPFLLQLA